MNRSRKLWLVPKFLVKSGAIVRRTYWSATVSAKKQVWTYSSLSRSHRLLKRSWLIRIELQQSIIHYKPIQIQSNQCLLLIIVLLKIFQSFKSCNNKYYNSTIRIDNLEIITILNKKENKNKTNYGRRSFFVIFRIFNLHQILINMYDVYAHYIL